MEAPTDDSDRDIKIIDELGAEHQNLVGVIQRRSGQIRVILKYWQQGNIASAINALNMMNDLSVVMDVLNSTFAQDKKIELLNYDNVCSLLPHAMTLVNSKYETYINAGLRTTANLLKHFQAQII